MLNYIVYFSRNFSLVHVLESQYRLDIEFSIRYRYCAQKLFPRRFSSFSYVKLSGVSSGSNINVVTLYIYAYICVSLQLFLYTLCSTLRLIYSTSVCVCVCVLRSLVCYKIRYCSQLNQRLTV